MKPYSNETMAGATRYVCRLGKSSAHLNNRDQIAAIKAAPVTISVQHCT